METVLAVDEEKLRTTGVKTVRSVSGKKNSIIVKIEYNAKLAMWILLLKTK